MDSKIPSQVIDFFHGNMPDNKISSAKEGVPMPCSSTELFDPKGYYKGFFTFSDPATKEIVTQITNDYVHNIVPADYIHKVEFLLIEPNCEYLGYSCWRHIGNG